LEPTIACAVAAPAAAAAVAAVSVVADAPFAAVPVVSVCAVAAAAATFVLFGYSTTTTIVYHAPLANLATPTTNTGPVQPPGALPISWFPT
jgi:hypothetical protein